MTEWGVSLSVSKGSKGTLRAKHYPHYLDRANLFALSDSGSDLRFQEALGEGIGRESAWQADQNRVLPKTLVGADCYALPYFRNACAVLHANPANRWNCATHSRRGGLSRVFGKLGVLRPDLSHLLSSVQLFGRTSSRDPAKKKVIREALSQFQTLAEWGSNQLSHSKKLERLKVR